MVRLTSRIGDQLQTALCASFDIQIDTVLKTPVREELLAHLLIPAHNILRVQLNQLLLNHLGH